MDKSPKYLSDTPYGDDFFKIHTNIAETLFGIIKSENVSKHSFTFGLLGEWGSGKSLTVGKLKEKCDKEKNILFIEFDIWKYIDTSLYRSILIDLEKELKIKAQNGVITSQFKDGYKSDKGENLYDILYSHTEFTVPSDEKPTDKWLLFIENAEKKWWSKILSYIFLRPANLIYLIGKYLLKRTEILVLIGIFITALILCYVYKESIYTAIPFTTSQTFKFLVKLFIGSVIGVAALEFLKEFFKDAYKELAPKTPKNILITSPPTFAQDHFEAIFKDIMKKICSDKSKKIVIVFDNIDRCETAITLQILTGLKTFLDVPNCFYLIPCDDGRIKDHFKDTSRSQDDFLDKIFQAYLRIPVLTEENKIEFIEKCLTEAEFDFKKEDKIKIAQILTLAYKGNTPRQIKRFFNDFVSYYKLAKTIDLNDKFLLRDISHFTFMITIKQKWPMVEETLIKNPSALINFHAKQGMDQFPPDFRQYLETCIDWIDLDSNVADFIYLTDAKQTGSNIQRIMLENFDGFILNQSLIKEIDQFLLRLTREAKFIFLEKAIERLMHLTKKYLSESDKINGIELFKIYTKHVFLYDGMGFENKKQSYILSHNPFFSEYAEYIPQIGKNKVSEFEVHSCKIIRQIGFNEITSALYGSFVKCFKQENLARLFENSSADEWVKLNGFVLKTDPDYALKIVPIGYFNHVAVTFTFTKDESNLIQLFTYFSNTPILRQTRQTIAVKLNQYLSTIYQTGSAHGHDPFILQGLRMFDKEDWNIPQKASLSSYVQARINILAPLNLIDQACEYLIQGINIGLTSMSPLFANGQQFSQPAFFNHFIQKIPQGILEIGLAEIALKDQIFNTAKTHNAQASILAKLSDSYLKEKTSNLCYNEINCLLSLLDELTKRKANFSNDDLNKITKGVLNIYAQNHNELLVINYPTILQKLASTDDKKLVIEAVLKHFIPTAHQNSGHIISLLKANENASDFLNETYEAHKIQFLSIDTVEFFEFLFHAPLFKNQSDYLDRILQKNENDLKGGSPSSNIIESLEKIDPSVLLKKKQAISNVISELIEPSRSDEDNMIGIRLFNKVKVEMNKFDSNLKNKIEALKTAEAKSEALKQLAESISDLN